MSQTETILLIVLGFSLAALIALFVGRFVWAMGLRFGARRMQKQVPSTVAGLQTERDRLRAEYAMLSQRLGSKLEAAKLRAAEQMAEVTRHRNRIEQLTARLSGADGGVRERDEEIARLKEQVASLENQFTVASEAVTALKSDVAVRDSEISSLKLAASAFREVAQPLAEPPLVPATSPEERLKLRIEKLANMSRTMANESPAEQPEASDETVPPSNETDDIQKELERLDAEWNRRLSELDQVEANQRTGTVANVISLANRIRALRKDIAK